MIIRSFFFHEVMTIMKIIQQPRHFLKSPKIFEIFFKKITNLILIGKIFNENLISLKSEKVSIFMITNNLGKI